ncbi:white isoform X1 [Brachionus plicatilis]|uniref:White isoform X1 n=1 Tax=Brachionus plicatilis TaxID=10195 RepID=A0A3M7QX19_BRAPC|nr:white isoform X1 [Brachionus plicatilis]
MNEPSLELENSNKNDSTNCNNTIEQLNHCVTLTWKNLTVVSSKKATLKISNLFRKKEKNCLSKKTIINNVSGIAQSNEILAIMGASGAGKTSLLNALNFRNNESLNVYGEIKVNGQLIKSQNELSSISGYVQQDDLFIESLTVKETLIFQAMLRMDESICKEKRLKRVEEVMHDLNLKKCQNISVDIQGKKGISGGEKRRLAFACEILTDPLILFCDEPTSGLDSFIALSVMECMKSLAKQGRTIICTIHQPSSEIFELFDRLCLLSDGKLAFNGPINKCNQFFESQGYKVPVNYNPADFYIKTLANVPSDKENSLNRIKKICDGYENSDFYQNLTVEINEACETKYSQDRISLNTNNKYRTSLITQMYWLLWRNIIVNIRSPQALRVQLIQSIFVALLFGVIYFKLKINQKGIQNITSLLFLCESNNSFASIIAVINTFPAEIPVFVREHQNRMYRVISYYMSRILIDLPVFIVIPIIFVSIIYWMSDLSREGNQFIICICMIILVAQCAVSFGTFLSAVSPDTNTALALTGPILAPFMIFSGVLLNSEDVPSYFLLLRYLSWFSYGTENLLVNQFEGIESIDCDYPEDPDCLRRFEKGIEVLDFYKLDSKNFRINTICLVILTVGWRLLAFMALIIKSRRH